MRIHVEMANNVNNQTNHGDTCRVANNVNNQTNHGDTCRGG